MEKLENGTVCDVVYRWQWKPKALILTSLEEIELARKIEQQYEKIFIYFVSENLYEWSILCRCDTEVLLSEEFN